MKRILLLMMVSLMQAFCSAIKTVKLLNRGNVLQQTFKTEIPLQKKRPEWWVVLSSKILYNVRF
jgi:hypothetical protein